jgi:hypothetical protein
LGELQILNTLSRTAINVKGTSVSNMLFREMNHRASGKGFLYKELTSCATVDDEVVNDCSGRPFGYAWGEKVIEQREHSVGC